MRSKRFTRVWREAVREAKQLEDDHRRRHPMIYGYGSHRFPRPRPTHVPWLAYEWRRFFQ